MIQVQRKAMSHCNIYIFSIFILKLTKLLGQLLENFKKLLKHLNNVISKEIV